MIKKYGRDLFLPEGDDYSKTEFNQHHEEMQADGQAVLQKLRMEQMAQQQKLVASQLEKAGSASAIGKGGGQKAQKEANPDKKLSYKEMLERAVARK